MSGFNKNAPELILEGEKWAEQNENYATIPDRFFQKLGTRKDLTANERLLLLLFIGQAYEGFHPSRQWILERTGMNEKTYDRCRNNLVEKGIIETQGCGYIKIFLDNL